MNKWYEKGLRFKCTECGKCCSGFEGFVWLSPQDIEKLSKHFGLTSEDFLKKYTRKIGNRTSLIEKRNFDCIFYKDKKCTVYQARPSQCKTFPFWPEHLKKTKDWTKAKKFCEGIDHPEGDLIPLEKIQKTLQSYFENKSEKK